MANLKVGLNQIELKVYLACNLQHDCLVGLDFMGKVDCTKDKL